MHSLIIKSTTWQPQPQQLQPEAASDTVLLDMQSILHVNNSHPQPESADLSSISLLKLDNTTSCEICIGPPESVEDGEELTFDFSDFCVFSNANNVELYKENMEYIGTTTKTRVERLPASYFAQCNFSATVRACKSLVLKFLSLQVDKTCCHIAGIYFTGVKWRKSKKRGHQQQESNPSLQNMPSHFSVSGMQNSDMMSQLMSKLIQPTNGSNTQSKAAAALLHQQAPFPVPIVQSSSSDQHIELLVKRTVEQVVQEQVQPMVQKYVDQRLEEMEERVLQKLLDKIQQRESE